MKYTTTIIIALLTTLIVLTSTGCNENEMQNEKTFVMANTKIENELIKYNQVLPKQIKTKSIGIGYAGWISVVLADGAGAYKGAKLGGKIGAIFGPKGAGVGAIVGGAIIGGASSYSQYQTAKKISEFSPYSLNNKENLEIEDFEAGFNSTKGNYEPGDYDLGLAAGIDSCYVRIGIQHNRILNGVQLIHFEDKEQTSNNLTELELQIINSSDFSNGYYEITSNPLEINTEPGVVADRIINLYIDAISNSCSSEEDIITITSNYTQIVKSSSELSEAEKEWLFSGFATMCYSYKYWNELLDF